MTTLRSLRRAKDLTQADVAALMRVHPTTVYKWEKGLLSLALYAVPQLAGIFGVEQPELLAAALESCPAARDARQDAAPSPGGPAGDRRVPGD